MESALLIARIFNNIELYLDNNSYYKLCNINKRIQLFYTDNFEYTRYFHFGYYKKHRHRFMKKVVTSEPISDNNITFLKFCPSEGDQSTYILSIHNLPPFLETLIISALCTKYVVSDMLPETLVYLDMDITLFAGSMKNIPKSLKYLLLHNTLSNTTVECKHVDIPLQIKYLYISNLPHLIHNLPDELEMLKIDYGDHSVHCNKMLPSKLRHATLNCVHYEMKILPPSLEFIDFGINFDLPLDNLPISTKYIKISNRSYNKKLPSKWPPNIKMIDISCLDSKQINFFPETLTHIIIGVANNIKLNIMPVSIKCIIIEHYFCDSDYSLKEFDIDVQHLKNLKTLKIYELNNNINIKSLPTSLNLLNMPKLNISSNILDNLPMITHLNIMNYEYYSQFPASLKVMVIDTISDGATICNLPDNLEALVIKSNIFTKNIKKLPNLLKIFYCLFPDNIEELIPLLPESLVNLSISFSSGTISYLPDSLKILRLVACCIFIGYIPPRLEQLAIHININDMRPFRLPKTLKILSVSHGSFFEECKNLGHVDRNTYPPIIYLNRDIDDVYIYTCTDNKIEITPVVYNTIIPDSNIPSYINL